MDRKRLPDLLLSGYKAIQTTTNNEAEIMDDWRTKQSGNTIPRPDTPPCKNEEAGSPQAPDQEKGRFKSWFMSRIMTGRTKIDAPPTAKEPANPVTDKKVSPCPPAKKLSLNEPKSEESPEKNSDFRETPRFPSQLECPPTEKTGRQFFAPMTKKTPHDQQNKTFFDGPYEKQKTTVAAFKNMFGTFGKADKQDKTSEFLSRSRELFNQAGISTSEKLDQLFIEADRLLQNNGTTCNQKQGITLFLSQYRQAIESDGNEGVITRLTRMS